MPRYPDFTLPFALGWLACASCSEGGHSPHSPTRRQSNLQEPHAARPIPPGSHDGRDFSLLTANVDREPVSGDTVSSWQLPFQAKLLIVNLMATAAHDRLDDLPHYLTPHARWGLPDRREVRARPVFDGDDGGKFFAALRTAAARFAGQRKGRPGRSKGATFACPPLLPAVEVLVRNGAEPMWCYYHSDDRLDWLVFRMVMHEGRANIDYVGLFEERPRGHVVIRREDPPPPLMPPILRSEQEKAALAGLRGRGRASRETPGDGPEADGESVPTRPDGGSEPGRPARR